MPATTITIDREQRDGLYELVRNHLGSVGDLFDALERDEDAVAVLLRSDPCDGYPSASCATTSPLSCGR